MKVTRLLALTTAALCLNCCFAEVRPDQIEFRRMAVRRMIFDRSQEIPLAGLDPSKVVGLELMYPEREAGNKTADCTVREGKLVMSAGEDSSTTRWAGGFNPFATYDVDIQSCDGSGRTGIVFSDRDRVNRIQALLVFNESKFDTLEWTVFKDGAEVDRQQFNLSDNLPAVPLRLRVQMLAVGANLYIEQNGVSTLIGQPDFVKHFELRRKELMRSLEFCLHSTLKAGSSVTVNDAAAVLTPGCGQADIRAMTRPDGAPLLDEGRLWITMTVRGRGLPHPLQGVFSLDPSVFDIRFEGIIVFDMGDGLLRNELASHIFYDAQAMEWRGWTTGFSSYGNDSRKEKKAILAVTSQRDPRRGFSVMTARPIGLEGEHEDPHGVYDAEAGKWRLLLSERAGKYRAGMWESDQWDRGYQRLTDPVPMDSTGTMLQKIGSKRYAIFGSADRKVYIRTYPDLKPAGELKMHLPPWNDKTGTRIWPNVIPLPEGYPARYIAVMMDRLNFPGMKGGNWTYGAMYLYHGVAPDGDDHPHEY